MPRLQDRTRASAIAPGCHGTLNARRHKGVSQNRAPPNGWLSFGFRLSVKRASLLTHQSHEMMVCISPFLEKPHYVFLGLLRPEVGIGDPCWARGARRELCSATGALSLLPAAGGIPRSSGREVRIRLPTFLGLCLF